jgi:c-di-GMP-binding flagellar brake protein YcgR
MTGSQRRRSPRVSTNQPVKIRFRGDKATVGGCLTDLGWGGAYVRCSTPVEIGRQLACGFELDSNGTRHVIRAAAEVVWVAAGDVRRIRGPGFGVRFVATPPEVIELLKRAVSALVE